MFLLSLLASSVIDAAAAVNYLQIQTSASTADGSLYLQIVNTVPPANAYIHFYGSNFIMLPAVYDASGGVVSGFGVPGVNTIYVAGVPAAINIMTTASGTLTPVALGGAVVNLPVIAGSGTGSANQKTGTVMQLPDGLIIGAVTQCETGCKYVINGASMAASGAAYYYNASGAGTYASTAVNFNRNSPGRIMVQMLNLYTDSGGYKYYQPMTYINGPIGYVLGY